MKLSDLERTKNVLEFYALTNKLKAIIREGWKQWRVSADRVESIAEHVYSTCMLAIAIDSEFNYGVDLYKVVFMLAIHELEEIIIGDITPFSDLKDKKCNGRAAVAKILGKLVKAKEISSIIDEYVANETKEAKFAKWVDKLDAGLQCKIYDMGGFIDISGTDKDTQARISLENVHHERLSDTWLEHHTQKYNFDETFTRIAHHARNDKNWPVD